MGVEAFAHTEEAFAADALFEAYRNNDEEGIASIVKSKQLFKHLDHQVARLATRLPSPASRVRRMARKLRKLMAQEEEDEEGEEGGGGDDGGLL
ncbi:hypothetical protein TSOC_008997 [Tetrabaena socialis]|uniref:Uncharacterized protein n=1 Tax=Tetrabaena socialis TaxID=47790 RepID=A0A2J7ZX52_9CHLO|nr:hypothetical protein TSOC_008997 [Tetrabaena socialis]|eukprot:PNH04847.1 hypothetical protein TSOC_008997 [Tetrabaena socialis]